MPIETQQAAIAKHALASQRRDRLQAMIALARPDLSVSPDALDVDPNLLNCPNGTLDLRTGELRPHRQEDLLTKMCGTVYDPHAQSPTFDGFLERIFRSNLSLIPYVQRAFGYAATGCVNEQGIFFLYGIGSNGKTTLIDALMNVLGDYASKADPDLLMAHDGSPAHPTNVADLMGKRLVVCSETNEGRRFDESRLKDLAGETRLKARFMRQDFFEFDATHKIFMYSNHRPVVRGTDNGFWRRIKLIPFLETIGADERDTELSIKLNAEATGILRWIVDGAVAWYRDGLGEAAAVNAATAAYRSEMDGIGVFINESCVQGERLVSRAEDLYDAYINWCGENGEHTLSQRRLGTALAERGYRSERCSRTGKKMWRGIGIISRRADQSNLIDATESAGASQWQ